MTLPGFTLDLLIFSKCNPTKLYILIPTKQTLTQGLDTNPNPHQTNLNPSLSPNPSPSSYISQEMTVHEIPLKYLMVQEDTWQVNNFAGLISGDPGSVLISDLPWTYGDSTLRSGVQLIQHAN